MAETSVYTKIAQMINDLAYEAFTAKVPITIFCQIKKGDKEEIIKNVVSPAAVQYEGDTTMFYDLQNIMSGNFTTTPKQSREEDVDPFE